MATRFLIYTFVKLQFYYRIMGTINDKRDVYYRLSKKYGYRARSVFKLKQIDKKYNIFYGAKNVVDLCAAPGSWSQYAAERLKDGIIIAIDVQEIKPLAGVIILTEDITAKSCEVEIIKLLNDGKADLILCDGAPDITGLHDLDEYLQSELLLSALGISIKIGKLGSTFVGKCFYGIYTKYIVSHFKKFYENVKLVKPRASKSTSTECFLLCRNMTKSSSDVRFLDTSLECENLRFEFCGNGSDAEHIE